MKKNLETNPLVEKLISIIGTQQKVAEAGNVCTAMVWKWLHNKAPITPQSVIPLEVATNGQLTRSQLRPDLYPE